MNTTDSTTQVWALLLQLTSYPWDFDDFRKCWVMELSLPLASFPARFGTFNRPRCLLYIYFHLRVSRSLFQSTLFWVLVSTTPFIGNIILGTVQIMQLTVTAGLKYPIRSTQFFSTLTYNCLGFNPMNENFDFVFQGLNCIWMVNVTLILNGSPQNLVQGGSNYSSEAANWH